MKPLREKKFLSLQIRQIKSKKKYKSKKKEENKMELKKETAGRTPTKTPNNILTQFKQKLEKVKLLYDKGFIIIPAVKNEENIYKRPVWKGTVEEQRDKWNYEEFVKSVKRLETWNYGVLVGKQKNGRQLIAIDVDVDFVREDEDKPDKLLEIFFKEKYPACIEKTPSGRTHLFFYTEADLSKYPSVIQIKRDGWEKRKENKVVQGMIEIFTDNKFVATYSDVLLNELPVLTEKQFDNLLKFLGYIPEEKREIKGNDFIYTEIRNKDIGTIIRKTKELYETGLLDGYSIEMGLSAYMGKVGANDDEIKQAFKEIYQDEYDNRRTEYIITRTREKNVGIFREYYQALKKEGISLFSKEENKQKNNQIQEAIESVKEKIFLSEDMRVCFYLDKEKEKIYTGSRDDGKFWILSETGVNKNREMILANCKKVEYRFTPELPFGLSEKYGKTYLNGFKKSLFMEFYKIKEKRIKTIEDLKVVSIGNIQNEYLKEFFNNLFGSDEDFRAFCSFLVLKLAGEKAGYVPVIATNQGAGKSNVLTNLMRTLFSDEYVRELNFADMNLNKTFNTEMENSYVIVMEEMHIRENVKDDRVLYERLKKDTRSKKILINKKNVNVYETDFLADFIGYTNNPNPILINDTNDRRFFILKNFESRNLYDIYSKHGLVFDEFYEEVEKGFLEFVKNTLCSITTTLARGYLELTINNQNETIKREMYEENNMVYTLIKDYPYIEDYLVSKPKTEEEEKAIKCVKRGLATPTDIAIVLRLMGDTYFGKNSKKTGRELEKAKIEEIRTPKRRLRLLDKRYKEIQKTKLDHIYENIAKGYFEDFPFSDESIKTEEDDYRTNLL